MLNITNKLLRQNRFLQKNKFLTIDYYSSKQKNAKILEFENNLFKLEFEHNKLLKKETNWLAFYTISSYSSIMTIPFQCFFEINKIPSLNYELNYIHNCVFVTEIIMTALVAIWCVSSIEMIKCDINMLNYEFEHDKNMLEYNLKYKTWRQTNDKT